MSYSAHGQEPKKEGLPVSGRAGSEERLQLSVRSTWVPCLHDSTTLEASLRVGFSGLPGSFFFTFHLLSQSFAVLKHQLAHGLAWLLGLLSTLWITNALVHGSRQRT